MPASAYGATSLRRSAWVLAGLGAALLVLLAALAVASSSEQKPGRSPSVWYSPDGSDWTHIALDFDGDQRLIGVAASDNSLVAAGSGKAGGSIWVSATGQDWANVWSDADLEPEAVAAGGPGWVVVGGSWDGAIYTSSNGADWRRVYQESAAALLCVANADSTMVAGGGFWAEGDEVAAAVWLSDDGEQWSRVTLPEGSGAQVTALTAFGPGLLAVADTGAVWHSLDGEAWERLPTTGLEPMGVIDVAGGDSVMAVGWEWSGNPAIWLSDDARSWREMAPPEGWEPHGAVASGEEFLALGQHLDCEASAISVSTPGTLTETGTETSEWLSNECRDGISYDEEECEPASARVSGGAVLADGSVVLVGHW